PALVADAGRFGNQPLTGMTGASGGIRLAQFQGDAQNALVAPAQNGQRAVRGHVAQRLVIFEIIAKLGPLLLLAGYQPGDHPAVLAQGLAQTLEQPGALAEAPRSAG